MTNYSDLTPEKIDEALSSFFDKKEHKFGDINIVSTDENHYRITGAGMIGIIRKEVWDQAMINAANKKP